MSRKSALNNKIFLNFFTKSDFLDEFIFNKLKCNKKVKTEFYL